MENAGKVAIADSFLDSFAKLPRQEQGKTTEFINKFRVNPTSGGIHLEKISDAMDGKLYSARIDNTYRAIIAKEDHTYLILWVDHHDEAYNWAKRRRCEVNPLTGALQVFEVQTKAGTSEVKGIFSEISDEDLRQLGVPEEMLSYVKEIPSKQVFENSVGILPKDVYENLSWLAEGFSLSEVLDMLRPDPIENVDTPSVAKTIDESLSNPKTQSSFFVVENEDELRSIMAAPLEKWRVFLHPTQRRIVGQMFHGPARVLGSAGTGKTVVAMHRAKYLAGQLTGRQKVLFTTFTVNLAKDIEDNLRKICTNEEMKHIEVINIDALVHRLLSENDYHVEVLYDEERLYDLWNEAMLSADPGLGLPMSFYREEWVRVVEAQAAYTMPEYLRASRIGRGVALNRGKRMKVYAVFEKYMDLMKEKGVRDANMAMYECTTLVEQMPEEAGYPHIVVDEGQDLSPSAYRLLRAMAGKEHDNDLFIAGDAHQRIYENRATLSKCGINIRGRARILKINYRTTEEIRSYAMALLNGIPFDDLNGNVLPEDPCQSLTHGDAPVVRNFRGAGEELDFIDSEVKRLQSQGVGLKDICVVVRTRNLLDDYRLQLEGRGYRVFELRRSKTDDRSQEGLRIATMHRVKGLEFKYVIIAAVNDGVVPLDKVMRSTSDDLDREEKEKAERCLLYVSITRAQKGAYVLSYGRPSPYLQ